MSFKRHVKFDSVAVELDRLMFSAIPGVGFNVTPVHDVDEITLTYETQEQAQKIVEGLTEHHASMADKAEWAAESAQHEITGWRILNEVAQGNPDPC